MNEHPQVGLKRKIIGVVGKTPLARDVLEWVLVRREVARNSRVASSPTSKTPWVFERDFDLAGRIGYIDAVIADYFQAPGIPEAEVVGARILEIGPGESLGVALRLLSLGAASVTCVDRFDSLVDPRHQWMIYEGLIQAMDPQRRRLVEGVVRWADGVLEFDRSRLEYVSLSVEDLDSRFAPGSFDIVLSRAVLEHVFAIEKAMEVLDRQLRPGGLSIHEVDYRDHGIFTEYGLHPLTMFRIGQDRWESMGSNLGAPNRRLHSWFRGEFLRRGYGLEESVTRCFGEPDEARARRSPRSLAEVPSVSRWIASNRDRISVPWSGDDLRIAAAFLVARKPEA